MDGAPAAGSTVVAKFTLKAAENYVFADDFTVVVKDATNVTVTLNADKDEAYVVAVFKKADPIVISGNSLKAAADLKHDVELPDDFGGEHLNVTGGISASLTVKSLTWSSEKAVYGETLTAQIKLDSTTSLAGLTKNDFTAEKGYEVTKVETVGVDGTSVIVTLEAPAVAKAEVTAPRLNTFTAPTDDAAAPSNAALSTDATGLTITTKWYEGTTVGTTEFTGENFVAGKQYTVVITITLGNGYTWPAAYDGSAAKGDITGFSEDVTVNVQDGYVTFTATTNEITEA